MSHLWLILHWAQTAALILTLPARQRTCEIYCIWNFINYTMMKNTIEKELKLTHTHTYILKLKKAWPRLELALMKKILMPYYTNINALLLTELQRKLIKMLKVTYIIMIMYYVMPMIPLYNGFYLFPLSCAINLNYLIFDPSEVEIHQ